MSSLDHLLCSETTERRTPTSNVDSSRHSIQYTPTNSSSSESGARANPRRCSVPDCQKTAKRGGRCIAHGGGNKCAVEGCVTSVVSRGLCVAHGGGKRCQTPACTKSAQSGGFCWVHGGGKKCGYRGCPKRAQSGGACISHGGGKRCRIDGCNKVVQYDGLCVGHGGYRKCVSENCNKRAMANDYCQQHGGSSVCVLDHCYKRAVRGGMCSEHKTAASLQAVTASGLSTPSLSSDGGRDQRVYASGVKITASQLQHSRLRSIGDTFTSRPSLECQVPTSCTTRRYPGNNCAPRSSSPNRSFSRTAHADEGRDSPVAPGFSALLNADDRHSPFSTYSKFKSGERYSHHHRHHHHHEQKVYPLLPRLEELHNYRDKSRTIPLLSSIPVVKSSQSELRIVVTEDPARRAQTPSSDTDYQERDELDEYPGETFPRTHYVQSYYYSNNDGRMARSTTQTQHHDRSKRHN